MSSTLLYKVSLAGVVTCANLAVAQQAFVTCWDDQAETKNYARHVAKTAVTTSEHGWQAYIDAEARPAKLASGNCVNTSRLMLRSPKGAFRVVYITRPAEWALGNHLELLGWWGDKLLFNDTSWQYASDASGNQVVILNATSGTFDMPELAKMVAERLQLKCDLQTTARRWEQGKVLFAVADTELGNEGAGCLEGKPQTWLYDPKTLDVVSAPEESVAR
jgi:hypothetical protein